MRKVLYRLSGHFTLILFTLVIGMILGLLLYTRSIVNDLREQSKRIVEFYGQLHSRSAIEGDSTLTNFLFEQVIKQINFPIIYTDNKKIPSYWRNVPVAEENKSAKTIEKVKRMVDKLQRETDPVPLVYEYENGKKTVLGYLFYGDSNLIARLIWLPYIEIGVILLFILAAFFGFRSIKKSEEQFIWMGLTKETAHQLGTPLSSLLGWQEILKSEHSPDQVEKILPEIENDLQRLSNVTARFSQIGSRSGFKKMDALPIIEETIKYFESRLPQTGKEVKIIRQFANIPELTMNKDLFEWVIENLIKNSIDSIQKDKGIITISTGLMESKSSQVFIDIADDGRGISPQNRRRIFKPGFSTKKRGWGLGLNLAKRIVEEFHRGKLFVKESKIDEGTTMRIILMV